MAAVRSFLRREPVLIISLLAAGISCFFVPPDAGYLGYIDFRTLALLYCLMTVVSGLKGAGLFSALAHTVCDRARSARSIGLILVCLCFFSSMLITNDVALLAFVPLAAAVFSAAGRERDLIRVVVMQTAAANLGSMLTPVGSPQNLYLYSYYDFSMGGFLSVTFPIWAISLVLCAAGCLSLSNAPIHTLPDMEPAGTGRQRETRGAALDKKGVMINAALFAVCLMAVARLLAWPVMLLIVAAALLIYDRRQLIEADFTLLLTFVAFFIFAGNLARIDALNALLKSLLAGREYLVSLLTCQAVSNVPAALLLSGFTSQAKALLLGVDIGGLGTPIASLASLISVRLYSRSGCARLGLFLLEFTAVNFTMLLLLSAAAYILVL